MSGVPPGYNPSDSLLSGGTTPITGVMGGGGIASASDSLLSGGESAIIQGVQGGGKAKRALSYRRKRRVQKGGLVSDINKNLYIKYIKKFKLDKLTELLNTEPDLKSIVNIEIEDKKTALIYLLENIDKPNVPQMIELLINAGADVTSRGSYPLTPLSLACSKKNGTIARMLLKAGADLNAINFDGTSTLDVCKTNSVEMGADAAIINKFVSTVQDKPAKIDTYISTEEAKISPEQYLNIGTLDTLYPPYLNRKKLLWKDEEPIKKDSVPPSVSAPSVIGPYDTKKRLITVIPSTTKNLLIFPPINGDIKVFQRMLIKCEQMKLIYRRLGNILTIEENTVFVFMPPFYKSYIRADTAKMLAINKQLFTAFLSVEANNNNQIFVLTEHTNDNVIGGNFLNPTTTNIHIPNLVEPSYILYPYARGDKTGILLSAKGDAAELSLPAREYDTLTSTGLRIKDLFNHHTTDATSINIAIDSNIKKEFIEDDAQGFKFDTLIRYESLNKVVDATAPVGTPRDTCKGLISSVDLVSPSKEVITISPWKDISGSIAPYFIMLRLIVDTADAAKPYCETVNQITIKINETGNKFVASNEAKIFEQSANIIRVSLEHGNETKNYVLRDPSEDDTASHWSKLIFTEDEAAFLNDLNFSPNILKDALSSGDWKTELVEWMKTYALKKCFGDANLLTNAECIKINDFMKKMYTYFNSEEGQTKVNSLAEDRRADEEAERKKNEEADPIINPLKDGTGALIISDINEDGAREFTSQKIAWNMINPIEVAEGGDDIEGKGPNTYSLGLLMVKHLNGHPEQYRFGSVKVKAGSTEEARTKIKTKITDLRAAYPLWSFIY
jgi:hypothetical protein